MSVRLYVGNLSYTATAQEIREIFAAVGSVETCEIVIDRITGRSRGFGFVDMSSMAEAENAVAQLDARVVNGRDLRVSRANLREQRSSAPSITFERSGHEMFQTRAYFKQSADIFGS